MNEDSLFTLARPENDSRYNTGVLFHTPRARLRVTTYVTYLSSHGGTTTVIITQVFCFIHLMLA